jgi:hypothetical protein
MALKDWKKQEYMQYLHGERVLDKIVFKNSKEDEYIIILKDYEKGVINPLSFKYL